MIKDSVKQDKCSCAMSLWPGRDMSIIISYMTSFQYDKGVKREASQMTVNHHNACDSL